MQGKWRYSWDNWYYPVPELAWIQIEVSTFCNANCIYCPRTLSGESWRDRHLSLALFSRLRPLLPNIPYVHLQGWGEPLMNPDFFAMTEMVVKAGARCGTTTNGVLVDAVMAERLVASGLDIVGFSLTGVGEAHNQFRPGAPFLQVINGMHNLASARNDARGKKPSLHIAYMLLAQGLDELDSLSEWLDDLAADQVVISTLDYVPHPLLRGQAIIAGTPLAERAAEKIAALTKLLGERGIRVTCRLTDPSVRDALYTCTEQVHQTMVVGVDGKVFPCVFAGLAVGERNEEYVFGDLEEESLQRIWIKERYQSFRHSFRGGRVERICRDCPKRI